jgi:antirestriction protein ArdC
MQQGSKKQDIYGRITNQIVSHLETGVRPWIKPWNAEHAAGRITGRDRGGWLRWRSFGP